MSSGLDLFISYSHDSPEHKEKVLALANRLRGDSINVALDQYLPRDPPEGWQLWMEERIAESQFVLMICTETYLRRVLKKEQPGQGRGATWEAHLIYQHIYEDGSRNERFLCVIMHETDAQYIPTPLRTFSHYPVWREEGYEALLRRLTNQPEIVPPPLGQKPYLPAREPKTLRFGDASSTQEGDYLSWIANEMKVLGQQWHATPIVPTPAHRKKPLGWREKWRARLFRYDPEDYTRNPALTDSELSLRAGFGKRKRIRDLARELRKFSKIVVLGDPGSGKSVCLRQLVHDIAGIELAHGGKASKVPIYVDMGTYDGWSNEDSMQPAPVLELIRESLCSVPSIREAPESHPSFYISSNLEGLLRDGRIVCVFDALDEMPQRGYQERYIALKDFMNYWESKGNCFIYSCRTLDYDPAFNVDEVIIEPFDRDRIKTFLNRHVPNTADALYQRIIDDESLEELVSNPFFLQALAYINEPSSAGTPSQPYIPATRGQLVREFAEALLIREAEEKQRESLDSAGGLATLRHFLSDLAFALQERREEGTSTRTIALQDVWGKYQHWGKLLWIARRARIVGKRGETSDRQADAPPPDPNAPERIEFVHHRLQELFAAEALAQLISSGHPVQQYLEDIWWHETVILAMGLLKNPDGLIVEMLAPQSDTNKWTENVVTRAERLLIERDEKESAVDAE